MLKPIKLLLILLTIYSISSAQNGIVKSYYPDGSVQSEISYVNDILDGSAIWYYPNGQLKSEKNFDKGVLNGWVKEYYETGLLKEEYFVKNGMKSGTNRVFYENGTLKTLSNYSSGIQTQLQLFDYDPNYHPVAADTSKINPPQNKIKRSRNNYQCNVGICPEPVGGMKSIQDNLVYPEHALRYGLEGTVSLITKISSEGKVVNIEIARGMGFGCSEAAQEAVKKTKFLPGENNGVPVESEVTLNIEFKIFENKSFPESKEK
ncbi:MAG: TonB family protein [Ignavibacteriales bacterium]|nr:MAG: TonB family protein [Ignavibacteriales bacterium]